MNFVLKETILEEISGNKNQDVGWSDGRDGWAEPIEMQNFFSPFNQIRCTRMTFYFLESRQQNP